MKALVLSGGAGTRLRPLTHSLAKQLIPVAGKPVLVHCLENIRRIGVTAVGIIVGAHRAQIESVIGRGEGLGLDVTYIPQDAPLGLAHCVLVADEFLGADDFVMYLGDNVFAAGIAEAAKTFRRTRPDAHLVVTKVADPHRYGVVRLDPEGVVRDLVEKPKDAVSNLAITGVYFFTPAIKQAARRIEPSGRGELEITDAIAELAGAGAGGRVTAEEYPGYWKDTGTIDDLLDCNRVLLGRLTADMRGRIDGSSTVGGQVIVEPGGRVFGSRVIGPVTVAAGSVIRNSTVGPHVAVGRGCVVEDTVVEDSILLDGAGVYGLRDLRHSLIGRGSRVGARVAPTGNQLVIGDDAQVELVP